jgi:hypothetical protein
VSNTSHVSPDLHVVYIIVTPRNTGEHIPRVT